MLGDTAAMVFKMQHLHFKYSIEYFTHRNAPDWLTSKNTIKGSTMDHRFFWNDYVMKLNVNESVSTDFRRITRID